MSQKISERSLILIGDIIGSEKIPLGVDGDLAITPDLLGSYLGGVFDDSYWPLGGVAELTNDVTLDGVTNLYSVTFQNLLDFSILSTSGTLFQADITGDALYMGLNTGQIQIDGAGIGFVNVTTDDSFLMSVTGGFFWETGAGASNFSLEDDHFHLGIGDGHIHSDGLSISLEMDDGVDSSTLSLTPLGLDIDFLAGGVTELNGDWNIANTAQAHSVIFGPDYLTTFDPLATFYAEAENIQLVSDVFYLASYSGVEIRALTNNGVALVVHDNESNDILKCEEIGGLRYTTITGLIKLPSYITANLPTVSEGGLFAFCTDEVDGEVPVFTNNSGTWLRVTDGSPPVGP